MDLCWLQDQIEQRAEPVPFAGCWLWTAGLDSTGYGTLYLGGGRKHQNARPDLVARTGRGAAHVLAWRAWNGGIEVPAGHVVMHACDIRCCCAPHHLSVGTHTRNLRDAWQRVRTRKALAMTKSAIYSRNRRAAKNAHLDS